MGRRRVEGSLLQKPGSRQAAKPLRYQAAKSPKQPSRKPKGVGTLLAWSPDEIEA